MKKRAVIAILIIVIIFLVYFVKSNKSIDKETAARVGKLVEEYIERRYEGVETVEITDVSRSPMGGLMVDGIVNGHASFSAGVDESNNGYRVGSIGKRKGFPPLKEEYKEKIRD